MVRKLQYFMMLSVVLIFCGGVSFVQADIESLIQEPEVVFYSHSNPVNSINDDQLVSSYKPVISSSNENPSYPATNVNDNDLSSRWASQEGNDPEWIYIDLEESVSISRVVLEWEDAYAIEYQIEVSSDATNWTRVYSVTSGKGDQDDISINAKGRYVRMYGTRRATIWGYSLNDFKIFGTIQDPVTSQMILTSSGSALETGGEKTTMTESLVDASGHLVNNEAGADNQAPFKVSVNGINVPVYKASVDDSNNADGTDYSFAYFDFTGNVDVSIEELSGKPVNNTQILPKSLGIVPTIDERKINFKLSKPCNISVEPDVKNTPLLLFANPVDLNKPQINDDNVIYYGPGIHYPENGIIELTSNQTLYIDDGAIVKSAIIARGNNIKILGSGILCLDPWEWGQGPASSVLGVYDSQNVLIDGIIIRGAYHWTINLINCDGVLISNVKQVNSKHQNDNGCNIVNSRNVTIEDCFFRNNDDCIAIKGLDRNLGDIQNVTIKNSTFWCDRARILLIGHESRASFMKNITFENCDILHYEYFPIMVQPGEEMTVEDLTINNIRLNNSSASTRLMLLNPIINEHMEIKTAGNIRNCSIKNISVTSEFNNFLPEIIIEGYDTNHMVQDVDLQNISLNGTILDYENSNTINGLYTDNVDNIKLENTFFLNLFIILTGLLIIPIFFFIRSIFFNYSKESIGSEENIEKNIIKINNHVSFENNADLEAKKLFDFLSENYMDSDISLQKANHSTGISVHKIPQIINSFYNISFKQYINKVRIEEGKRLLEKSDLQITEIAIELGYNSITHFGRVFKQIEGSTPKEFRKSKGHGIK